ncbi:MAG: ATP-binding cassette domain-containing protein [Pseudomonadota bacterium]|jgi:heme-transporting ATPase|uniref:ABC transporter ATP-binding protein n=1 Tax=Burkholderiaceae TaxID=119060 RepID=UPI0010F517C0|nr:ATP-binding cassette domain-containing protein [Burkholderia sp. 4M9327F10]
MLRFENLCKRYGEHTLFQGLRYSVDAGCIALNDESGSGKSTLLGILAGEIEPDAGEVWLGGHSLRTATLAAKSAVAYVPEDCLASSMQTGRAFLEDVAAQRHTTLDSRTLELADRFGLTPHLEKRFEQMSFGTRKKICLSAAALGRVAVVIADEPGGGLDAAGRAVLIDLFKELGRDRVVFFTSYDTALTNACEAQAVSFADLTAGG